MNDDLRFMKPFLPPIEEYEHYLKEIWESEQLTNNGKLVQRLEDELQDYLGVKNIALFSNGHMSLEAILRACEVKGEVITTPLTFVSTTHAIINCGAIPVFADIKRDDLTIDPNKIEECITEKTTAILPVHVYGNICDQRAIDDIAKRHNLKVIYDAAHAFGINIGKNNIYEFGDASAISFHATKCFHTVEGGAVIVNDDRLLQQIKASRNFGLDGLESKWVSGNMKMSEFHAAMGLCNLKYADGLRYKRKQMTEMYMELLQSVSSIELMYDKNTDFEVYSYFYVIFKGGMAVRDKVFEYLKENGYLSRKYFYPVLTEMSSIQGKFKNNDVPIAKSVSESILCLPLYSGLEHRDISKICVLIKDILGE